jgi:hypothetical protein
MKVNIFAKDNVKIEEGLGHLVDGVKKMGMGKIVVDWKKAGENNGWHAYEVEFIAAGMNFVTRKIVYSQFESKLHEIDPQCIVKMVEK